MRFLHKAWQDKRPTPTRRVRWYEPDSGEGVRIAFEVNRVYESHEEAERDYEDFIAGDLSAFLSLELGDDQ